MHTTSNASKVKEALQDARNCPATQASSQSLSERKAQRTSSKDYIWLKPETYTLPDSVLTFAKNYNDIVDIADKDRLTDLPLQKCYIERDFRLLSEQLKSLSPFDKIPSRLAEQLNLPAEPNKIGDTIQQMEELCRDFLKKIQKSEAGLNKVDMQEASETIALFHSKYSEYKLEQDKISDLSSKLDNLKPGTPEYEIIDRSLDILYSNSNKLEQEYISCLSKLEDFEARIYQFNKDCIVQKVLASYFEERKAYLEDNQEAIKFLENNFFDLSQHPYQRYKDNFNKAWLDLMPADYYMSSDKALEGLRTLKSSSFQGYASQIQILPDDQNYSVLKAKLSNYHSLPKDNPLKLNDRHQALKDIANTTAALIKDKSANLSESEHAILQSIIVRANLKADYLDQLSHLKEEALARINHIPKNSELPPGLSVINTITQDLHDLDPQKRYGLEDLHTVWKAELKKDPTLPDFWIWLEGQDTQSLSKDLRHTFISRGLKHVQFINGLAHNEIFRSFKLDSKGLVEDGNYVYNIGEDGDLYIVPFEHLKEFRDTSKILFKNPIYSEAELSSINEVPLNHDTLSAGGNILCAGVVKFKDGKIIHIDTNSGHYKPELFGHLKPALGYFLEKNPQALDDTVNISDYDGKINTPYRDFKAVGAQAAISEPAPKRPARTLEDLGFKST